MHRRLFERTRRSGRYLNAAHKLDYSPLSDDEALRELRERVDHDPSGLRLAVEHSSGVRADFISDRTFRLLSALAGGTSVRPIDRDRAELFEQEEALGRLPLHEACEYLSELEPGLLGLERDSGESAGPPGPRPYDRQVDRAAAPNEQKRLVGIGARSGAPLLSSPIAAGIVRQYLAVRAGGTRRASLHASYFDAPEVRKLNG